MFSFLSDYSIMALREAVGGDQRADIQSGSGSAEETC